MNGTCPFCGANFEVAAGTASRVCPSCGNAAQVHVVVAPPPVGAQVPVPPGAGLSAGQAPPCARHPRNAAVTACVRCGDFVCNVCATPVEGTVLCVKCFEFRHTQGDLVSQKMSFKLPTTSMVCGILGVGSMVTILFWALAIVFGPAALITGILAMRQIRAQPALGGQGKALAGVILGAISLLGFVAFAIGFAMLTGNR